MHGRKSGGCSLSARLDSLAHALVVGQPLVRLPHVLHGHHHVAFSKAATPLRLGPPALDCSLSPGCLNEKGGHEQN